MLCPSIDLMWHLCLSSCSSVQSFQNKSFPLPFFDGSLHPFLRASCFTGWWTKHFAVHLWVAWIFHSLLDERGESERKNVYYIYCCPYWKLDAKSYIYIWDFTPIYKSVYHILLRKKNIKDLKRGYSIFHKQLWPLNNIIMTCCVSPFGIFATWTFGKGNSIFDVVNLYCGTKYFWFHIYFDIPDHALDFNLDQKVLTEWNLIVVCLTHWWADITSDRDTRPCQQSNYCIGKK